MPSRANLLTGYNSCWFPGDIVSYPFNDLYSHEPNRGELLSMIVVYEFEHITKTGRICVFMISFSQPGFLGSKVQWNTTVRDKYDGYIRPSFRRRSLQQSILATIVHFIREITN